MDSTAITSDQAVAQAMPSEHRHAEVLEQLPDKIRRVNAEVAKAVYGQNTTVNAILLALFARGHCLLTGVPGLAKTLLVRAMARAMKLSFSRIQFTPDLMPADITGTVILQVDPETQRREFAFAPGPIFAHMLLADEVNRTPPKTQAALLEAMQEKTVTAAGATHPIEEPFIVLATQNPIEQEGTYPLPEAQLDRFLFEVLVRYPSQQDELQIVGEQSFAPLDRVEQVLTREEILAFREAVAAVPAPPNVLEYAVRLARASRPEDPSAPDYIKQWIRWGASPRAAQALLLAARTRAACTGRFNAACDDVAGVAVPVLRHRLVRTFRAEADAQSTDEIIGRLLNEVKR